MRILLGWWQRFFAPRIENNITRNSKQICRFGELIKQGEAEVIARFEKENKNE